MGFQDGMVGLSMRPDARFDELSNFFVKYLNINELTIFFRPDFGGL
jgi:hypothetical protein